MKAKPIFDALAALKAVRQVPVNAPIPSALWSHVMSAEIRLNAEIESAGLQVEVKPEQVKA